jgi:type III pantothenate kinase
MVFVSDLSNSSITLAVFASDGKLVFRSDITSDRRKSKDEYFLLLNSIFDLYQVDPSIIEGAIISSVVPPLSNVFSKAIEMLIDRRPLLVGPGVKTGLDIKIDHHSQLGSDLVANTVAALDLYKKPFTVIDMDDTATTFTAVNMSGELCGVIILPGVRISLDALSASAAELPYISLVSPKALLGTNTVDSMNSGMIFGSASMLDGLIQRLSEEFSVTEMNVIATGGIASYIIPYCSHEIIYNPDLVLEGLFTIYKRNQRKNKSM